MTNQIDKFLKTILQPTIPKKQDVKPISFTTEELARNERNQVFIVQTMIDINKELINELKTLAERLERHETRANMGFFTKTFNLAVLVMTAFLLGNLTAHFDLTNPKHKQPIEQIKQTKPEESKS